MCATIIRLMYFYNRYKCTINPHQHTTKYIYIYDDDDDDDDYDDDDGDGDGDGDDDDDDGGGDGDGDGDDDTDTDTDTDTVQIQIQIQIHLYVQYMSENMETPKSASESPLFLFKVRFSGSASGISVGALRVAILSCHPGMGQDL